MTPAEITALAIGHGAAQKPAELERAVTLIASRRPRVVVEIGRMTGGTLAAWCECATEDALLISIDLPGGRWGGENVTAAHRDRMRSLARPGQQLELVDADSHDPATRRRVLELLLTARDGVDLLFIDGDHTLPGVAADYATYAPMVADGGLVALHDILEHPQVPDCQVDRLWACVKHGHSRTWEFCAPGDERGYGPWGGIGIIEWGPA